MADTEFHVQPTLLASDGDVSLSCATCGHIHVWVRAVLLLNPSVRLGCGNCGRRGAIPLEELQRDA